MILYGYENYAGKEKNIGPAERAKSEIRRGQGRGGHEEDADPDAENPDQADVVCGFPFDDPDHERNIEKRKYSSRPNADLVEDIHSGVP